MEKRDFRRGFKLSGPPKYVPDSLKFYRRWRLTLVLTGPRVVLGQPLNPHKLIDLLHDLGRELGLCLDGLEIFGQLRDF